MKFIETNSNLYYSSNLEEMEIVVRNQYNFMILPNIRGTNNNNNICYKIINILVLSYNYYYYYSYYYLPF